MKKVGLRPIPILLAAFLLTLCLSITSFARAIDISAMSYEELSVFKTEVDTRMAELERQYAIENGNRIIHFEQQQITLFEKQKQQIIPTVERVIAEAPEETSFIWTTSDENIATVSTGGSITGVSAGSAVITCTAKDDEYIFAELPVTVVTRVNSLALSDETLTLRLSEKATELGAARLSVTIEPENAFCQTVTWTCDDENIATVNEFGQITAVAPGKVTITASSDEEMEKDKKPQTATCKVTIVKDVSAVTLDHSTLRVQKGSSEKVSATVAPDDATNAKVAWESSNSEIATVSGGQITGRSCGTCIITCRATDDSAELATCEVTVYQPITSIKIDQKEITAFIKSNSISVKASIQPEDATDTRLEWTSTDPAVATVDQKGYIKAVGGGSCKIVCTALDGSEKQAEVAVRVPSITVAGTDWVVTSKNGLEIPVQFFGHNSFDLAVSVSSQNTCTALLIRKQSVLEGVSMTLKVIPKKAGKATVTLKDKRDEKSVIKLNVEIAHSAVYDSTSYPKADYKDVLRYPGSYKGRNIQIYGKVLQKLSSGSSIALRVGTSGRGSYDSVFYVTYSKGDIGISIIEDDYITIYGTCTGTKTYETVMGNDITIPSMTAEKIKYGK